MHPVLRSLLSRGFLQFLAINTLAQGMGFGIGYLALKACGVADTQALPIALPFALVAQVLLWVVRR